MDEQLKYRKGTFSKIGWNYFIGSLMMLVLQFLCVYIVGMIDRELLFNDNVSLLISIVTLYLAGMPVMALMMKAVLRADVEKRKLGALQLTAAFFMAYALMFAGNIIGNIVTDIIGRLKGGSVDNVVAGAIGSANPVLIFVYMVILAPIAEELVFRKLIVDRTARFGQRAAIVLSGFMFGLFHGNLNQFAYAFLVGMFFAFIYVKTGEIRYTIILHMIINFIGSILSVLVLRLTGAEELISETDIPLSEAGEIISGGKAGLAVYIVYMLILFAVAVAGFVLLWRSRRRFASDVVKTDLPKGAAFKASVCNPGMLLYSLLWTAIIIWQFLY